MKLNRMVKSREKFSKPELVVSGRIFYKGKLLYGSVGIREGKIVRVAKTIKGDENLDFGGAIILPGFTDLHVHFREPGMEHKENFESGSKAGLRGGITTYFEMPNTKPAADRFKRIEEKIAIAKKKSYSDFGIYALVSEKTEPESVANADAFKIFMAASTESEEFGDYAALGKVLEKFQHKPVAIHAEHKEFIKGKEVKTLQEHYLARKEAEKECVRLLMNYSSLKFHLCHISNPECLALLQNASEITFECTPHHLLLNINSGEDARYKVNPPLRTSKEQQALFEAFAGGKVKFLASDHAPHLLEEKEKFENAASGMPGIETMVPIFIYLAKHGKVKLEDVVEAGALNPAKHFGLKKGEIVEGNYADLTVWNPLQTVEIKDKDVWSKCGWSPFSGWEAVFPSHVYLRGNLMLEDYEFVGRRAGQHVWELKER